MCARTFPPRRNSLHVLAASTVSLILSGCGGGSENLTDPPDFITGVRPAPGTATYEPVPGGSEPGAYAFPTHLYEDGPECRKPEPPTTCPPVRIGIEDTPVDFTHPSFHGRVVLEGATFAYWRPLASEATQRAFAGCTEAAPCRVFHIDSGGDPAVREDRARAVLERMGLPERDNRWFLYDLADGDQGWYELPGIADYEHGSAVASVALGARFHPFPFPNPVIVPMARNFDPIEQREGQHYFSDLIAEGRRNPDDLALLDLHFSRMLEEQHAAADIVNGSYGVPVDTNSVAGRGHVRTWREDFELLQQKSPLTWAEYTQHDTPCTRSKPMQSDTPDCTLRVWATGNHQPGSGVPPSVLLEEPFDRFPNVLAGDGHRSLEALGPYYFPELRGEHLAATALGTDEERLAPYANPCGELPDDWDKSEYGEHFCLAAPVPEGLAGTSFAAPYVAGVLAHMKARYPGVPPLRLVWKLMHTADGYQEAGFDGDIHVARNAGDFIEVDGMLVDLGEVDTPAGDPLVGGYAVVQRGCRRGPSGYLVSTGGEGDLCVVWAPPKGEEDNLGMAEEMAAARFLYLYGAGRVDVDAYDEDEAPDRAGAFAPMSAPKISVAGGVSAPAASTRLRAPAAYGSLGERLSGLSVVGFDAMDFPFRYSVSSFVDDSEEHEPVVPEFLTDLADNAACHPLLRLAPGLVCSPWVADASLHALVSPEGAGAAWRFSEGLELSAFTRHRGRLDGAARGAFSFDGGSSLAALRLGRSWPLDGSGRWRMRGELTLTADLPRGLGERPSSMLVAGPALLSDWSIGLSHASRNLHTRLSLSQPPRAETGHGALTLPSGRREDGTRTYRTHRISLVPSRRQLTLRLEHQRPFAGGDVVVSVHRTKNRGHSVAPSRYVAGIAWRRTF